MKLLLTLLVIAYVLLPYDFLPDFIVGLGWLDDIGLLSALWYYLYAGRSHRKTSGPHRQQETRPSDKKDASDAFQEVVRHESNDPYIVLGIDRGATREEIRNRYRELARRYHPDKVAHLGNEFQQLAEEKFKAVQWAYRRLSE
jgi:uncharacterized membrane protein YkvA (DUF1232 family)